MKTFLAAAVLAVLFATISGAAKADDVIPAKDAVGCKGLRDSNGTSMPDGSLNEAYTKGMVDAGECFRVAGAKYVSLNHERMESTRLLVYVPGQAKPMRLWVRYAFLFRTWDVMVVDTSMCVNDCRDE